MAADRLVAGECACMVRGVVLEGVVLADCREPNRSCGRGGAGALTAAESDGALSRQYVRLGLVLRPLLVVACASLRVACGVVCRVCIAAAVSGHALRCGSRVVRCAEVATGWRRIGSDGGECARMVRGVVLGGCGARGLQRTESEMRAWRRWRAHCRRV